MSLRPPNLKHLTFNILDNQSLRRPLVIPFSGQIRHLASKRLFDLVFSVFMLILTSPLLLLIAIAVKISSHGPCIFGHTRIGRGGRAFRCYKFRTMYQDADQRLQELLLDPVYKNEWLTSYKLKNDPRVTPLGRFLRKTSLDELPQFYNVLRGDLSVVGPRPVVKKEVENFIKHRSCQLLSLRPGLTCTWQVSGRSNTSYDRRIAMDLHYIQNRSLMMDINLIARTVPAMLSSRGAY